MKPSVRVYTKSLAMEGFQLYGVLDRLKKRQQPLKDGQPSDGPGPATDKLGRTYQIHPCPRRAVEGRARLSAIKLRSSRQPRKIAGAVDPILPSVGRRLSWTRISTRCRSLALAAKSFRPATIRKAQDNLNSTGEDENFQAGAGRRRHWHRTGWSSEVVVRDGGGSE